MIHFFKVCRARFLRPLTKATLGYLALTDLSPDHTNAIFHQNISVHQSTDPSSPGIMAIKQRSGIAVGLNKGHVSNRFSVFGSAPMTSLREDDS